MESVIDLLQELNRIGVKISAKNGSLEISDPRKTINEQHIISLKEHKVKLLEIFSNKENKKKEELKVAEDKEFYKLSFQQKRMYFLQGINPENIEYNMPGFIELPQNVSYTLAQTILDKIVQRHDCFRQCFIKIGDEIYQRVQKNLNFKIEKFSIDEKELEQLKKDFIKPFNFSEAPLLRVAYVELSNSAKMLFIDIHHIISDGTSLNILQNEFISILKNENLEPLKYQYKDYSEYQNILDYKGIIKKQEEYWINHYKNSDTVLNIPTDYPRLNNTNAKGKVVNIFIPKFEINTLKQFNDENTTTNIVVLSLFSILLSKLSGQDQIIIGLALAGRKNYDLENIVGNFVNSLPVKCSIKQGSNFSENLQNHRKEILIAYDNQDYQFDQLVERLNIKRLPGRNPLFDVMVNTLNIRGNENRSITMEEEYEVKDDTEKRFDLTLNVGEFNEGIRIGFQFDQGLFKLDTIVRITRYFKKIIKSIIENPNIKIEDIFIYDEKQISRLEEELKYIEHLDTEECELSYHQERIWFIDKFERGNLYEKSPVYHNIPLIIEIDKEIDENILEKAVNSTIANLKIFRSQFYSKNEKPYCRFKAESPVISVCKQVIGKDNPEEKIQEEVHKPFSLETDTLLRIKVLSASDKTLVVITSHYIINDRESLSILTKHIWKNYKQLEKGEQWNSYPDKIQYNTYNKWQKDNIQEIKELHLPYWKRKLNGRLQVMELPEDRKRALVHIYKSDSIKFEIDNNIFSDINNNGQGYDDFVSLLCVYKILLSYYNNKEEVVIGAILNSGRAQLCEKTIGPLSNLVVLRSFLERKYSFNKLRKVVSQLLKEASKNGILPFDLLVNELLPEKDMSRTALFDILFQYEDHSKEEELDYKIKETNLGLGKYDLNLLIVKKVDRYECTLVYNIEYFNQSKMNRFVQHFESLMHHLVKNPQKEIKEIGIISESEKAELLRLQETVIADYPQNITIDKLFENQVDKAPSRIAVIDGDKNYTYQEINNKANQIAYQLNKIGVGIEDVVALYFDRSVDVIVTILGILKAGGAYLPIDKVYPQERINLILENSSAKVIIFRGEIGLELSEGIKKVNLDEIEDKIDAIKNNLFNFNKPTSLAYIIYTSGSTGIPKGVMIEHKNLVRLFFNSNFQFDFNENDVWTLFHSHGFDFSVWEMYGALLRGGKVEIIQRELALNSKAFYKFLQRQNVTVLNQTPTAFYNIIEEDKTENLDLSNIRYVIFGGDALNINKLKRWKEKYKQTKLINMYGITETTVHVTYKEIGIEDINNEICTIGTPIPTTYTMVMNEEGKLQPFGIVGEICVGGDGVGRGYLKNSELTAQKFILNPYDPSQKLYKSGDLGRMLESGEIEYLGRADNQVQLRGFRIELGEIENAILKNKKIQDCKVLAQGSDDKYLCAYIIWYSKIDDQEIKNFLSSLLPEYMVPSIYVELDEIPMTNNGKVDIKALPIHDFKKGINYIPPSNKIEEKLVEIWSDLLNIDKKELGIDTNFFTIGGHSLKAAILSGKIHKELGVEFQLKDLFLHTTIKLQAEKIKQSKKVNFVSIPKAQRNKYYPLSSAQKRLYLLQQYDLQSVAYNMPYHFTLISDVNISTIEKIFSKLIERHESFRTCFKIKNDEPVQIISEKVDFKIEEFSGNKENIQSLKNEFIRPFDLSKAPLLRVALVHIQDGDNILMIDLHHIISDGVSQNILEQEFKQLYAGNDLQSLKLEYKDYSVWQNSKIGKGRLEEQEKFWLKKFEGELPVLDLQIDFIRPQKQSFKGANVNFILSKEETSILKSLAEEHGLTLYMAVLSVYNILLSKLSRQNDIVVGTPLAGRNHPDLEGIVGMFVNTLALRSVINPNDTFEEFVAQIKQNTLESFENQEYQFDNLVSKLDIDRDTGRNPIFDVVFNLLNQAEYRGDFSDWNQEYVHRKGVSKFDLILTAIDYGEQLLFNFEYCTDLFLPKTIEKYIGFFKQIINEIKDTAKLISEIELINDKDRQELLYELNNTVREYPENLPLSKLIEQISVKFSDSIALQSENTQITYELLNKRSNQLARKIIAKGIKKGDVVALIADRSERLIISMIAIAKTGATCLPINYDWPKERINFMFNDTNCALVLYEKILIDPELFKRQNLEIGGLNLFTEDDGNLGLSIEPTEPIYIIYTSGTTGTPKGVLTCHNNVSRVVLNNEYITLGNRDNILQLSSYTFDGSVFDIYGALLNGAKLIILNKEEVVNIGMLLDVISQRQITKFFLTTALFNAIVDYDIYYLKDVQKILFGGEQISKKHVKIALQKLGKDKLIHVYGPTETTVFASYYNINEIDDNKETIPIGKPISNTAIYLLDDQKRLVPKGTVGELYIGGKGNALGYLNSKDLTSEKFVRSIYNVNEVLYKTGDLGRMLPDGNIEFKGRIDHQVKMRGFRIELGEIESCLASYNGINTCVVDIKSKESNKYIVAYYAAQQPVQEESLKQFMAESLPDFMLPSYFVCLESIPLNNNGKVDRKALPFPEINEGKSFISPENEKEEFLTNAYSQVLGLEKDSISTDKSFFELGGDSIKSIQLAAKIRNEGFTVTIAEIFANPSIKNLSKVLYAKELTDKEKAEQGVMEGNVLLTPIQKWFFENEVIDKHHFNQAVMLNFPEGISKEKVIKIFIKIQEHHDALRIVYSEDNEQIVQNNNVQKHSLYIEEVDFNKLNKNILNEELLKKCNELQESIDLANGPLMKLGLYHTSNGSRLLIVIHHLVIDGVSWRILFEDIENLYNLDIEHEQLKLPIKTTSYKSWASELENYKNTHQFKKSIKYWEHFLQNAAQCCDMKKVTGKNTYELSQREVIKLDKGYTESLLRDVHHVYGTQLQDFLLAALVLTYKDQFDTSKVLIDLEGHGREDIIEGVDLSRTVGWFTSIYPILLEFEGELGMTLKSVKEATRLVPNKGFDYLLYKYSKLYNEKNSNAKSLISFNYLGQFDSDVSNKTYEIAGESVGHLFSNKNNREYEWDVVSIISNGELKLTLVYSSEQYAQGAIGIFLNRYKENLIKLINYCKKEKTNSFTPSDLTYKGLSITELDKLQSEYDIQDVCLLTPMQEGMLYHYLLDPLSQNYFVQIAYQLKGNIEISVVEDSLNYIMKRYDILRTIFLNEYHQQNIQLVLKERKIDFNYMDIRDEISKGQKDEVIDSYKQADRIKGFNLAKDVLMRVTVLQLGQNEFSFIWSFHHILMDGWCSGIIINEFKKVYSYKTKDQEIELPSVKPFSEYIKWLECNDKALSLKYWENYLSGYGSLATIPYKNERNVNKAAKFNRVELLIPEKETGILNKLANENGITLNTIVQTAWGLLLSKYNNTSDVVFGAVVSGRPPEVAGVENMVGLFINTIPVRIQYDQNQEFIQKLKDVQNLAIDTIKHHYNPLPDIQNQSVLGRGLLDHVMAFENYPVSKRIANDEEKRKTDFSVKNVQTFEQSNYDFSILVGPGKELLFHFNYNENIYSLDTVIRIKEHLHEILNQVCLNERTLISKINILNSLERQKIIYEFNSTQTEYDKEKTIHELFEEEVDKNPDKIAVVNGERKVSYKELDEHANQIANYLIDCGIQLETLVGLELEPSYEFIVCVIAVFKAGGAYLPIDKNIPKERIKYIVENSQLKILIHNSSSYDEIRTDINLVNLNLIDINKYSKAKPNIKVFSTNLAYVIYTSGTSGNPKGTLLEHKGIVSENLFWKNDFRISTSDRCLQFSNISFDASVWETWLCLLNGASLFIPEKEIKTETELFEKYIVENKITVATLPPIFVENLKEECFENFRLLITAGSETNENLIRRLNKYTKYINAYGPTETSVCATCWDTAEFSQTKRITIGKPIRNLEAYILDANKQLQGIGIPGELCISGDGLARGYLYMEELTKEKFIKNPFKEEGRLYCTGDLARWLPDGTIEFLGRIDNQVKIRGHRVELGEISNTLLKHPHVNECIVVAKEKNNSRYLCAYMLCGNEFDKSAIREYIKNILPDYMIPAHFICMESFPLNTNGKIDIKLLPEPEPEIFQYVAPKSEIEEKLAAIWGDILGIEPNKISIDANFFELGGHSMHIIKVVQKIKSEIKCDIKVVDFFRFTKIQALASYITNKEDSNVESTDRAEEISKGKNSMKKLLKQRN